MILPPLAVETPVDPSGPTSIAWLAPMVLASPHNEHACSLMIGRGSEVSRSRTISLHLFTSFGTITTMPAGQEGDTSGAEEDETGKEDEDGCTGQFERGKGSSGQGEEEEEEEKGLWSSLQCSLSHLAMNFSSTPHRGPRGVATISTGDGNPVSVIVDEEGKVVAFSFKNLPGCHVSSSPRVEGEWRGSTTGLEGWLTRLRDQLSGTSG